MQPKSSQPAFTPALLDALTAGFHHSGVSELSGLSELDVLIVDCQTTGATPAQGSVLELGWCLLRPSRPELEELQAHWVTLPEGEVLSRQVRRLTGFDDRFRDAALAPSEAWQRLRASTRGSPSMPTAIHFARFELAFLRDWAERFEPEAPFPLDAVCAHAVACRLYPDLPRRGLRALAGHLGHGLTLVWHSLGHVEATAFVWRKLVSELSARGIRSWEALQSLLAEPAKTSVRPSQRSYPLARSRYRALPDAPGVYRFLRSNGDVLYVGKAASLRKRVASHFRSRRVTEHGLEMLTQVSDLQVTVTPTPLEAALLENETIKALQPPYNQQLTARDNRVWFARQSLDATQPLPDSEYRLGPLPSPFSVAGLGALIALLSGASLTRSLLARAVGTSPRGAPEPAVFEAGLAEFANRHALTTHGLSERALRRQLLELGAKLLIVAKLAGKDADADASAEDDQEPDSGPADWDLPRILRHLERILVQGYQLLRRAQWLSLLEDSDIAYREPTSEKKRWLVIRGGQWVDSRSLEDEQTVVPAVRARPANARKAAFDRTSYDRLRILTTELKRLARDNGSLTVYLAGGHQLTGERLTGVLRYV